MGGGSMKIERKNWEGCPHRYHLKYPCPLKFFNVPKETLQNTQRERERENQQCYYMELAMEHSLCLSERCRNCGGKKDRPVT